MKRFLSIGLAFSLAMGSPITVFADDSKAKQVEQLSRDATAKYREKDYTAAIELFTKAYEIEPVPNLLFNIARCYEKLEDWDSAIANYQKFVVEPDVEKSARQSALDRIDALNEVKLAQAQTTKTEKTEDPVKTPPPVVEEGPDNTWAYVTLGTGLVLVGGGVGFGLLASGKQTEFEEATTVSDKQTARDSGQTFALVADGMYIVGGVVTLVGAYMLLTSGKSEKASAMKVVPTGWVEANGGGVGLSTRF